MKPLWTIRVKSASVSYLFIYVMDSFFANACAQLFQMGSFRRGCWGQWKPLEQTLRPLTPPGRLHGLQAVLHKRNHSSGRARLKHAGRVISTSVVFCESVRKNAWDCFEKKVFAENRHFQGTANFGYLEAIKCHFEARNRKFGPIVTRIQSCFIFCPLHLTVKGPCRKSSLSRNSKFWVLRGNQVPFWD